MHLYAHLISNFHSYKLFHESPRKNSSLSKFHYKNQHLPQQSYPLTKFCSNFEVHFLIFFMVLMEEIILQATPETPTVSFNATQGKFEIKGRSIPKNPTEFYSPICAWLEEYSNAPHDLTIVDIKLEYFNTVSSKCILDLLKVFEGINGNGSLVKVNWYYEEEDEEMEEAGEDFHAIVKLPFNMVKVKGI